MKNKIKIFIVVSVALNIGLTSLLLVSYYRNNKTKSFDEAAKINLTYIDDNLDYYNDEIYHKIFIEKDTLTYRNCFNYNFQEHPIEALLLANTFYKITKNEEIKKDIEAAENQLRHTYPSN